MQTRRARSTHDPVQPAAPIAGGFGQLILSPGGRMYISLPTLGGCPLQKQKKTRELVRMLAKTKQYRPSDKEPFMNERQREYFRAKLLAWREDILKKKIKTTLILPTARPPKPTAQSNCARVTDNASSSPRSMKHWGVSRTAPTAIARKLASQSLCVGWKHARSPHSRSKRRSGTSVENAYTAMTESREVFNAQWPAISFKVWSLGP
jgi:hypothetical protein